MSKSQMPFGIGPWQSDCGAHRRQADRASLKGGMTGGMSRRSAQAKERKDGCDNDHQANDVDHGIHVQGLLCKRVPSVCACRSFQARRKLAPGAVGRAGWCEAAVG